MTVQETNNLEIKIEVIRKSLETYYWAIERTDDEILIKQLYDKIKTEESALQKYKNEHPDLFV